MTTVTTTPNEERRMFWVVFTNTDLTEGRGREYPFAVCNVEATARRMASRCYVMGSDGPIRQVEAVMLRNQWHLPISAVNVHMATLEDVTNQAEIDAKRNAIVKAKDAGLTDADIKAIQGIKA
jgi:hypothetical protein